MRNTFKTRRPRLNERTSGEPHHPLDPEKGRVRTLQFAVKLLAAKPRSVAELRERLEAKRWTTKAIVETVLNRLVEDGYLNDESFALSYATHRIRQRPLGRLRLRRDLALKGVSEEISDQVLNQLYDELPEDQLIERAIEKRIRVRGAPRSRAETKSLIDHLLRQGFQMDVVWGKVRGLSQSALTDDDSRNHLE